MHIPVLAYHAANIAGNSYAKNDHVAFAEDLQRIQRLGLRIVPLSWVVEQRLGRARRDLSGCVALSCDDGTDFDYFDRDYPGLGRQRSLFNLLLDFRLRHGRAAQPGLHLTCFVIADPAARAAMETTRDLPRPWISDGWWRAAQASGLMAIENHSFDHNHACLGEMGPHGLVRGDFHAVDDDLRAEYEVAQAQDLLAACLTPHRPRLFCYPFGHVSDFLRCDWLPRRGPEIGLDAAFGDGAEPVTAASDVWNLPRYICGWHWKSPDELEALLAPFAGLAGPVPFRTE